MSWAPITLTDLTMCGLLVGEDAIQNRAIAEVVCEELRLLTDDVAGVLAVLERIREGAETVVPGVDVSRETKEN